MKSKAKSIGTVALEEIKKISTEKPWEPVTAKNIPYSNIGTPDGYLFTHGSACASMATTSAEGFKYVSDMFVYRRDGTTVDRDRYIGSLTKEGPFIDVLLVNKNLTPHHHIKKNTPALSELPKEEKETVLKILKENEIATD